MADTADVATRSAQVVKARVLLKERVMGHTAPVDLLRLEADGAEMRCELRPGAVNAAVSVQDVQAHDLCTHDGDVSECLLSRWQEGAARALSL